MKNQVQLCTYVDRISGGDLHALTRLLAGPLKGLFGATHLLPFFYPIDGADAGFDPIDHTKVDPRLGDWRDIKRLTTHVDVMADVIVNHVSAKSPQFLDFSANGSASRYAGMFLTLDHVFPNGATELDLKTLYRPRPGLPCTEVTLANGETKKLWTTFTPQQLDIDVGHPEGRAYLEAIVQTLAAAGVNMVRLDAAGYAIKKAGTSSFMLPETFAFIRAFTERAHALGIEVLVEVHSHYRQQIEIAKQVDYVYDFALPPLALHAIFFRTARYLKSWLAIRPHNAITVLDTHDGIGVIDIGADATDRANSQGLVPDADISTLVETIHKNSQGASAQATGQAASNLDLYQVNCTFYDALARDDNAYLLARALQFFVPGVPQVYYVGLFAGENDMALLAKTGVGRDINRHYYSTNEVIAAMQRDVVKDLCGLIRFRNQHPAFAGKCTSISSDKAEQTLTLRWQTNDHFAALDIDFTTHQFHITCSSHTASALLTPACHPRIESSLHP